MSTSFQDTSPLIWTAPGIARHSVEIAVAEERYLSIQAEIAANRDGKGSMAEAERDDEDPLKNELALRLKVWEDAKAFHLRLREAPRISNPGHASTNVVITVKHLCDEMVRKRGASEENFLMGGVGECETDGKLRTYSANSPIGMAVKMREVGDIVTVQARDDGDYDVEILALTGLERFLESGACSFPNSGQLGLDLTGPEQHH